MPVVVKNHKFDLATDVKVEYQAPNDGIFTWNLSAWDNGDVWANTSTISWREVSAEVVSLDFNQQSPLNEGYQNLVASNLSLTLVGDTLNPDIQKLAYAGLPIKISIMPEDGIEHELFFYGKIRSYSVSYEPGVNRNQITIQASDGVDTFLNTLLDVDFPIQTADERTTAIFEIMTSLGLNEVILNCLDDTYTFDAVTGTYTVAELINPLLQFLQTRNSYSYTEDLGNYWLQIIALTPSGTPDVTVTDTSPQINATIRYHSITSGTDNSLVYNQVKVTDNTETVVSSKTAADGIQLNGVNSLEFQTNVTSPAINGATWADAVIADRNNKNYTNVSMNPLDENNYLSKYALRLPWQYEVILETSRTGTMVTKTCTKTALQMSINTESITITIELAKPE
jgi:hypothetical protein